MTQHQYEQQCFSSQVHLLLSSVALSLSSCLSTSPPLPQRPTTTTTTPPVCLAVTQSAMCVLKTLHNALLSLHSRSKRTIQHRKIAPCWFFFSSTITLFYQTSVPRDCTVDCMIIGSSIPLHVENQTEQMGNDQRFSIRKKKVRPDREDMIKTLQA